MKDDIDSVYGVPKKHISCPGCGRRYGHHNTKVCEICQECSKCCRCADNKNYMVDADKFIRTILE